MIVLAAALAALSAPAFAATTWTATPAKPSAKTGFIADSIIWNCGASGCQSASDTSDGNELNECKGLVREVGTLTAFSGRAAFDDAKLGKCNGVKPKT
jgi:hypothetical protein